MASPIIKIKRSSVQGKQPGVADLPLGELALNTYDGRLYVSKSTDSGVTTSIVNVSGIQIQDEGSAVGYANTINFVGSGVTVLSISNGVGIVSVSSGGGGGGGASVSISTVAPSTPTAGDLWYNSNLGRTFIYYYDGSSSQWVDAAPFNVGIITSLTNVSFNAGTATSPSMYFTGDTQTGFFSPASGNLTVVSSGSSILNVNSRGVIVTGIVTCTDLNSTSDLKLKQNVQTVENAIGIVKELRGVKFEWKENNKSSFGVVAQEVEEVLPDLVTNTDPKTVNYNGIIGVLIEAIKEQQVQIEELKAQINNQ